jgi:hypothetical protein
VTVAIPVIAVLITMTGRPAAAGTVATAWPIAAVVVRFVVFRAAILATAVVAVAAVMASTGGCDRHTQSAGTAHQQTAGNQTTDRHAPHP